MGSQGPALRYTDPSYQAAHDNTYAHPLVPDIPSVLPPAVTQAQFDTALDDVAHILGENSTLYTGRDLRDFIDPYDLPEEGLERKVPGAAIW